MVDKLSPEQVEELLRSEISRSPRLVMLLQEHAKNYADGIYRHTKNVIDHAGLLRLTGTAAGVEEFVAKLTASNKDRLKQVDRLHVTDRD